MNLVVDIGNTQVKAAAVEGTTIAALETFPSAEQADLKPILARYPIKRAIVASTGRGAAYVIDMLSELGMQVLVMTPDTPVPIGKEYLTTHAGVRPRRRRRRRRSGVRPGRLPDRRLRYRHNHRSGLRRCLPRREHITRNAHAFPRPARLYVAPSRVLPLRRDRLPGKVHDGGHRAGSHAGHNVRNRRIHKVAHRKKCENIHNFYRWGRKILCEKN